MPRPRSDIRQRILRSARRRFLEQGVDAASLRTIARGARTSIGMVYYYFPSKDDLFLAVVEVVYARLLADLEVALAPDVPPRERLDRLYLRIGAVSGEEMDIIRMIIREALTSTRRLEQLIARFQRGHMPLIMRTVVDGMADGSIDRRRHPALIFFTTLILGMIPQLLFRMAGPRLPFADLPAGETLSRELADLLFRGIGPAGDRT